MPAVSKRPNRHLSLTIYWVPLVLFTGGFLLIFTSQIREFYQQKILRLDAAKVVTSETSSIGSEPTAITINKYIVGIEPARIEQGKWTVSDTQATYLLASARLGQAGNIIVYGHNLRSIFGPLLWVKLGDPITLRNENGTVWNFTVVSKTTVDPAEISWLQPTTEAVLTLYTCTGFMDSKRLVVRAKKT